MTLSSTPLLDSIKNRRTIHHFKPDPVPEEYIEEALSHVVYAPNHHATYPYRFYPLGDKTRHQLLTYAYDEFMAKNPTSAETKINKWQNIPGWVLVSQQLSENEKTFHEDFATLSISLYIMMLALYQRGVGSKWSTGSLFFKRAPYEICQINPQSEIIRGMFWYGYAEKVPNLFTKKDHHQFITTLP